MATKDFVNYSPTSGNKNATISVTASNNTGAARSTSLNISAKGITKTEKINQKKQEDIPVEFILGYTPTTEGDQISIKCTDIYVVEDTGENHIPLQPFEEYFNIDMTETGYYGSFRLSDSVETPSAVILYDLYIRIEDIQDMNGWSGVEVILSLNDKDISTTKISKEDFGIDEWNWISLSGLTIDNPNYPEINFEWGYSEYVNFYLKKYK